MRTHPIYYLEIRIECRIECRYLSTHIMKSKQPNISNYFGTSQILLLNKQQTSHFTKSLSNDCLKLKFT